MSRQRANLADDWPALRTITDLATRFWNVRLTCMRCGSQRVLNGAGMWWLFHRRHWKDDIQSAARRFHCAYCRKQDGSRVRPRLDKTKDPPTGERLPDPPEHEWKRLIARYRS